MKKFSMLQDYGDRDFIRNTFKSIMSDYDNMKSKNKALYFLEFLASDLAIKINEFFKTFSKDYKLNNEIEKLNDKFINYYNNIDYPNAKIFYLKDRTKSLFFYMHDIQHLLLNSNATTRFDKKFLEDENGENFSKYTLSEILEESIAQYLSGESFKDIRNDDGELEEESQIHYNVSNYLEQNENSVDKIFEHIKNSRSIPETIKSSTYFSSRPFKLLLVKTLQNTLKDTKDYSRHLNYDKFVETYKNELVNYLTGLSNKSLEKESPFKDNKETIARLFMRLMRREINNFTQMY